MISLFTIFSLCNMQLEISDFKCCFKKYCCNLLWISNIDRWRWSRKLLKTQLKFKNFKNIQIYVKYFTSSVFLRNLFDCICVKLQHTLHSCMCRWREFSRAEPKKFLFFIFGRCSWTGKSREWVSELSEHIRKFDGMRSERNENGKDEEKLHKEKSSGGEKSKNIRNLKLHISR